MASKQYKKVYTIYKGYGNPTIQVHLVRETKKTYIDITASHACLSFSKSEPNI